MKTQMKPYCIVTSKETHEKHLMVIGQALTFCSIALGESEISKRSLGDERYLHSLMVKDGICEDCVDELENP